MALNPAFKIGLFANLLPMVWTNLVPPNIFPTLVPTVLSMLGTYLAPKDNKLLNIILYIDINHFNFEIFNVMNIGGPPQITGARLPEEDKAFIVNMKLLAFPIYQTVFCCNSNFTLYATFYYMLFEFIYVGIK